MTDTRQDKIRLFAFVIAIFVSVCFSLCFAASGFVRPDYPPDYPHKIELDSAINPNYASAANMARLPGIGITRAKAIVAYRESFSCKDSNNPVFRRCNDLQKVSGLGPKLTQSISEWLKFE